MNHLNEAKKEQFQDVRDERQIKQEAIERKKTNNGIWYFLLLLELFLLLKKCRWFSLKQDSLFIVTTIIF
jgi:hypothetical protein